jgi:hypothetical protein
MTLLWLVTQEEDPHSSKSQDFMDEYCAFAKEHHDMNSKRFIQMVHWYLNYSILREVYDHAHPKMAEFMDEAIKVYAQRQLSPSD